MKNRFVISSTIVAIAAALLAGAARSDTDAARLDAVVEKFMKLRRDSSGGVTASARRAAAFRTLRDELHAIPPARLTPEQQIDWMALKGQIAGTLHDLETLRAWEKNPELVVQFGSAASAIAQDGAPAARADRVVEQLNSAVAALAEARTGVKTRTCCRARRGRSRSAKRSTVASSKSTGS